MTVRGGRAFHGVHGGDSIGIVGRIHDEPIKVVSCIVIIPVAQYASDELHCTTLLRIADGHAETMPASSLQQTTRPSVLAPITRKSAQQPAIIVKVVVFGVTGMLGSETANEGASCSRAQDSSGRAGCDARWCSQSSSTEGP